MEQEKSVYQANMEHLHRERERIASVKIEIVVKEGRTDEAVRDAIKARLNNIGIVTKLEDYTV